MISPRKFLPGRTKKYGVNVPAAMQFWVRRREHLRVTLFLTRFPYANRYPLRLKTLWSLMDVIDLRDFYSQRLGIVARRLINRGIQARWPNAGGKRGLGLGYPPPYLALF